MTETSTIVVETSSGKLQGLRSADVHVFKGIPYGSAVDGEHRFQPADKPEPWTGVWEALEYGPSAPQPTSKTLNVSPKFTDLFEAAKPLPQSENCLVLNVWTRGLGDGGRRPVMVWLHGGAFQIGSGSSAWYDGTNLARDGDVVAVTLIHRLGPLGYLHLGDLGDERYASSGNVGMLDIVLALEWVRDNISAFGGDPNNVTIFGESGGGGKVSALLAIPCAEGLFHKAIIQSGPGLRLTDPEKGSRMSRRILAKLGVRTGHLDRLHDIRVEQLLAARTAAAKRRPFFLLGPVVDGRIIPQPPFDPVAAPTATQIPLLIGSNADESTIFMGNMPVLGTFRRDTPLAFVALPPAIRYLSGRSMRDILNTYRRTRPEATARQLFSAVMSDWLMRIPSIRLAERKLAGGSAPVYMYLFTHRSPSLQGNLGAAHGLDLPFVFNNMHVAPRFTGESDAIDGLAARMSQAWINFARSGAPNHGDLPRWPAYDTTSRPTMVFDLECRLENDPAGEERQAWAGARTWSL